MAIRIMAGLIYTTGIVVVFVCLVAGRATADPCDGNPCQNGGRCRSYSWSQNYFCRCTRPYFGRSCEKVSPCVSGNPCKNGGSCGTSTFSPGFYCTCPSSHVGETCEKENPCLQEQSPCENSGTCYRSRWRAEGYFCSCSGGYGGSNCQIKSLCGENPCLNGGTCRDTFWSRQRIYRCECPEYYKGDNCQHVDPCMSSPCKNGGTCNSHLSYGQVQKYEYYCSCSNKYYGNQCQHASECQTKICHNGGSCFNHGDGETSCICTEGFRGPTCQQKMCPVKMDSCQDRYMYSSGFINCTAMTRKANAERQTCYGSLYEEVKQLRSCDCLDEDVKLSIESKFSDPSNVDMTCLHSTSEDEWETCPEEAMPCVDIFRRAFLGPAQSCNETTEQKMKGCIESYERGILDLSTCPTGKAVLKMAERYKFYLPLICSECQPWELGRNCSALNIGRSALDYGCSIYENGDEIISCMLEQAEQKPQCRSLGNQLEGLLRSSLNTTKEYYREACTELAIYRKMWSEDWGCNEEEASTNSKRSIDHPLFPGYLSEFSSLDRINI